MHIHVGDDLTIRHTRVHLFCCKPHAQPQSYFVIVLIEDDYIHTPHRDQLFNRAQSTRTLKPCALHRSSEKIDFSALRIIHVSLNYSRACQINPQNNSERSHRRSKKALHNSHLFERALLSLWLKKLKGCARFSSPSLFAKHEIAASRTDVIGQLLDIVSIFWLPTLECF
jgi:hypothetical protein